MHNSWSAWLGVFVPQVGSPAHSQWGARHSQSPYGVVGQLLANENLESTDSWSQTLLTGLPFAEQSISGEKASILINLYSHIQPHKDGGELVVVEVSCITSAILQNPRDAKQGLHVHDMFIEQFVQKANYQEWASSQDVEISECSPHLWEYILLSRPNTQFNGVRFDNSRVFWSLIL